MYLSYLLGGQIEIKDGLEIYLDDNRVTQETLKGISWNLEPSHESYKNHNSWLKAFVLLPNGMIVS